MSGVLRTVGKVAGVVAAVAAFIPGGQAIAAIAGAVSVVANIGATVLAKKPPAKGSLSSITIGTDQPTPYLIGRTYYGGARMHQIGYGPTQDKVPNPYALIVDVYSGAGPVEGLVDAQADFVSLGVPAAGGPATGYAAGFLWGAVQRGLVPEPSALAPHYPGAPGWGASYRMSGLAAIAYSLLFDKKGKVFASGVPQLGAIWKGVKVYDPRKDSTYPGGAGAHRITSEATWEYSENPGLHALTYAYGRYQMGVKVMGVGIPADGIMLDHFVHLANVCDANGWTTGGVIFEPGSKWTNLKDILAAGGAEPAFVGGKLGLQISAPRVALDTITADDLTDGDITVGAMQGWEDRLNTLIPKYRSEPHKWEYVQSTEPVTIASYVAEDGEVKQEERQLNLVQDKDQAAQLCAYELLDRRELGEIEIVCKPRLRKYGPGDLLIVDIAEAGLIAQPCVVLKRSVDPANMTVSFVLRGETPGKHAFALGRTGTAPPTPAILSSEDRDDLAVGLGADTSSLQLAISASFPIGLTITAAADGSIVISDHVRRYNDGHADVAVTGATIASGLAAGSFRAIGYDDEDRLGAAVTYLLEENDIDARSSPDAPGRHYLGYATIPTAGSPPSSGGGAVPPGGYCVTVDTPLMIAVGVEKPAGEIIVGDRLWTRHEERLESVNGGWGSYQVEAIEIVDSDDVWEATVGGKLLRATGDHLVYTGTWVAMRDIGAKLDGTHQVAKITVTGAHTYVSNGILSHNIKQNTSLQ